MEERLHHIKTNVNFSWLWYLTVEKLNSKIIFSVTILVDDRIWMRIDLKEMLVS